MKPSRNFIESLSRGLSIVSLLSESSSPLNLTELSNKLHLSKSAIQRFTYTLRYLGYLEKDEETKKYYLGPKIFSIAFSIMKNSDLRNAAHPHLVETSKEIGETVSLAILDNTEIVFLERVNSPHIYNINLHVGSRLPAYCTSIGKVLLAFLPKSRLRDIIKNIELKPITPYTITNKENLKKDLKKVRIRGYAMNCEELSVGLRSVAAPVRNYSGSVVGGVNIAAPSSRADIKRLDTILAKKVIEMADKISSALGYNKEYK
jgi:PcaR/PcaU/PobR family beta-ketoadipate pathway transcriptional regulator